MRTPNAGYQPISSFNRQKISSIQARLLGKPSVKRDFLNFSSNLDAELSCNQRRECASSYYKHSNSRSNAHTQTFTASTQRGAVHKISGRTDNEGGLNQITETNAQPLELLSAVVRDANDNLLPNVPVVFTIEAGDASFLDTTGIQASAHTTGPNPAKTAQDGPAIFSGQIFDDKSKPLAGVKVSISRTNLVATSDAQGKFELNNIPPGRIDLFIDGRTVNPNVSANAQSALDVNQPPTSPSYPSLRFEAYAVKGRNNQLAHPIFLPPWPPAASPLKPSAAVKTSSSPFPAWRAFK